jgi:hypothetical protein
MSAGYAEVFVPREAVVDYFVGRNAYGIIDRLFLDCAGTVDRKGVKRRAWAFASSSDCAEALRGIDCTPGGARIWPGFHPSVPARIIDGEADEFLLSMRDALIRFYSVELKEILNAVESSARSCRERLLAGIEAQVQDIADDGKGGLFDALLFLEELAAFVMDTADVSEGEEATNLQQVRRAFDRAFTQECRLESPAASTDHAASVEQLRQELAQLARLRNLSAPPAVDATMRDELRWGEDEWTSFDQRMSAVAQQMQEEMKSRAQELAAAERQFQRARHATQPEQNRREQEITKCEETLRQTASECRKLLIELANEPKKSRWLWFWSSRQRRLLREKNERLGYLRGVLLPQQAREVVSAYASRMQFSVDRGAYEIRDSVIQAALGHVQVLYARVSQAITTLKGMRKTFASVEPPITTSILQRSLLTCEDLGNMFGHLIEGLPSALDATKYLSSWKVCNQPAAVTAQEIQDLAIKPFAVLHGWGMEDFLQWLKPRNTELEAFVSWLKEASEPLIASTGGDMTDRRLIRAFENSQVGDVLRHTFPEAAWGDRPQRPVIGVLQLRQLSNADGLVLGFEKQAMASNAVHADAAASTEVVPGAA